MCIRDSRHWATLPSTVHVLTADLPPGEHQLRVEFLDEGGRIIPPFQQTWLVDVPEGGESIYHFRSLPLAKPEAAFARTS